MIIKIISILCCMFLAHEINAGDKILIERYEYWKHPVLHVFKKYGISVYKVSYSEDGTCPTFYAKFKYSPDTRAPDAASFESVYFEALKANSLYPYALVDEEDDLRINVGWDNKMRNTMEVEMDKAQSISYCKARK